MKVHLLARMSVTFVGRGAPGFEIIGLVFVMNFHAEAEQANKRLI